jgi:hypothetical protein
VVAADADVAGGLGGGGRAGEVVDEEAEPVQRASDGHVARPDPAASGDRGGRGARQDVAAAGGFRGVADGDSPYAQGAATSGSSAASLSGGVRPRGLPADEFVGIEAGEPRVGRVDEDARASGRAGLERLPHVPAVLRGGPELLA